MRFSVEAAVWYARTSRCGSCARASLGELVGVDRVAAVGGQRDALAGLGVVAARLGELPRHPAHLDHGQAAAVHEHDRHLQDRLDAAADGVGGRVGEGLGAVAALEQERLAAGGRGQPVAQVVALAGEHQRRVGAQLRGRGGQGVGAVPGRLLGGHQVGPGQGHGPQGRPGRRCYRARSGCWAVGRRPVAAAARPSLPRRGPWRPAADGPYARRPDPDDRGGVGMRVLVAAMPFAGHATPMRSLARTLVERGPRGRRVHRAALRPRASSTRGRELLPWRQAPDFDDRDLAGDLPPGDRRAGAAGGDGQPGARLPADRGRAGAGHPRRRTVRRPRLRPAGRRVDAGLGTDGDPGGVGGARRRSACPAGTCRRRAWPCCPRGARRAGSATPSCAG